MTDRSVLIEVVTAGLIVMIALGLTSAAIVFLLPRLRPGIPLIAPLVLAATATVLAFVLLPLGSGAWPQILVGQPLIEATGLPAAGHRWIGAAAGLIGGVAVALGAFYLERQLLRIRARKAGSGSLLPGRQESIRGVARVARHGAVFGLVSLVSAAAEELLFRGAMLDQLWAAGAETAAGSALALVGLQAVLYGGLHLAFGWRTMLTKAVLGAGLAIGALTAGLLLGALVPHLIHQVRVWAQFRRSGTPPQRRPAPTRPTPAG